ncbi:ketopantoate reductase family protein [Janibacter alittae]|uniref:2-dehydropantoate 2-reductase n=1 Tax=Janibacter alittae TaxID=3115209 RepID=A0ABZ2MD31_9MICO
MTETQIRAVAVVGAGAMGAMYAAHFVEGGMETALIASGDRAARLRRDTITVNGEPLRARVVEPGVDDFHADLVLVAVKHHDLAEALDDVAPFVGPDTTFVSVLNGLDSEEVIADRFGSGTVLLCIALGMAAGRDGSAVTHLSPGHLVIGTTPDLADSHRLHAVGAALDAACLEWQAPEDMRHEMWWKFMVNTAINQSSAVLRKPYAAFRTDGPARSLMLALAQEVVAVSGPEGVHLGDADLARWDAVLQALPGDGHTSMLQDVMGGRTTEVALFGDRVVAFGQQHGVPTPINQTMSWILTSARQ